MQPLFFPEDHNVDQVVLVSPQSGMKSTISKLNERLIDVECQLNFSEIKELDVKSLPLSVHKRNRYLDGFKDEVCAIIKFLGDDSKVITIFPVKAIDSMALLDVVFTKVIKDTIKLLHFDDQLKQKIGFGNFLTLYNRYKNEYGIDVIVTITQDDLNDINTNKNYFDSGLLEHVKKNYNTLKAKLTHLFCHQLNDESVRKTLQKSSFKDKIVCFLCNNQVRFVCIKKLFPDTYCSVILKHSNDFRRNFLKWVLIPFILGAVFSGLLVQSYLK
jgi:hypothetical protein